MVVATGVLVQAQQTRVYTSSQRMRKIKSHFLHLNKNAPVRFTAFKIFSAGQNIVPNSVRVHHLEPLLLKCSRQVKISYQTASECTIQLHCFQFFLCSSKYRTKQRKNAPFSFTAFNVFSAAQSIVPNSGRMHHLDSLLLKCSCMPPATQTNGAYTLINPQVRPWQLYFIKLTVQKR